MKLPLTVFVFSVFLLANCTGPQKDASASSNDSVEQEITETESSTKEMESVKNEIEESADNLDSLLNEL